MEPGTASGASQQLNANGLTSINSYPAFNPSGGDAAPPLLSSGNTTGGLSKIGTVGPEQATPTQDGTKKVHNQELEQEAGVKGLTENDRAKTFNGEAPYYYYNVKPGSNGDMPVPYIKPVDNRFLGNPLYTNRGRERWDGHALHKEASGNLFRLTPVESQSYSLQQALDQIKQTEKPEILIE